MIFFVPGFISMRVYTLIVPAERHDFSKQLFDAIAFSSINFALLAWPIYLIHSNEFPTSHPIYYYFLTLLILFVAPVVWPFLLYKIMSSKFFKRHFLDPYPRAWDKFFALKQPLWVIVHLKSGSKIGGVYSGNSHTSAYPSSEQIFLEEVWTIDPATNKFISKKPRTGGLIINKDDFSYLEFYKN